MKNLQQMIQTLRVAAITDPDEASAVDDAAKEEWAYSVGLQIWMFGLPILRVEQFRRMFEIIDAPMENLPFAPVNRLGHMRTLPTASSDMPFTPNVDTLYSGSVVELSEGPLVFRAPAMPDRYWSLQVADTNMSNLPYLGTRTTGTGAGAWLLVAPDWDGEISEGLELYRCDSSTIVLCLRIRIEGEADTENVVRAQHEFRLTTLENHLAGDDRPADIFRPATAPLVNHDLAYFTTLCLLLGKNPPYRRDTAMVDLMQSIGLTPGDDVDPDTIDPAFRRGLVRAAAEGPNVISWKVKYRGRKSPSMWNVDLTGGSFETDYLARAEGAMQGLFVHDPIECTYFHTYHDGDGTPLDGSRSYTLRFAPEQIAPTLPFGFWSITGYGTYYTLIPNEHERYSVQSSDPALEFDDGGGITIHIGPAAPIGVATANWIATEPGDPFRLNYRVYLSEDRLRDPDQVDHYLPPIRPVS